METLNSTIDPIFNLEDRFNAEFLSRFESETQLAMRSVLKAGEAIRTISLADNNIQSKEGINNVVTAWDLASEKTIIEMIESEYPTDAILSEETRDDLSDPLSNPRLWVVDPLDGTANAKAGRDYIGISNGFLKDGKPFSGAIYDPVRDELFVAEKGKGAYCNGKQIFVSAETSIEDATITTDLGFNHEVTARHLQMLIKAGAVSTHLRGSSVMTMADVARGRYGMFFYTNIKPWDNAAAFPINTEAGGVHKRIDGTTADIMSKDVVVGNPTLVTQFIERINA